MADRTVRVRLSADVTQWSAAMRAAEMSAKKLATETEKSAKAAQAALNTPPSAPKPADSPVVAQLQEQAKAQRAAIAAGTAAGQAADAQATAEQRRLAEIAAARETAGQGAVAMGLAVAAGLAMSAKAAIDWESAWAGVTKTVDGSAKEMGQLEGELRKMARTLPISHEEIAGVAEAAGQLGVKREDIASFTKVMVDLGVSTNLSAQDAAESIAQMTNVMQTAPKDISRVGAALVALGNDGASTERDIMDMSQRLSGAGAMIGASESDVLALANAMSSLGIQSELGGGAMSRVLLQMYQAVKTGGPIMANFAKTAGMTADEFATAFREDPMEALAAFVGGLGEIKDAGGNVIKALDDVKIKGTQNLQVMLRLAGAGDLLSHSLEVGERAWKENNALTEEANKRYATVASQLTTLKNGAVDLAITGGTTLLPFLSDAIEKANAFIAMLDSIPGPATEVGVGLLAIGAATALAAGGFLLMAPRIVATRAALTQLAAAGYTAAGAMRTLAAASGVLVALYVTNKALDSLTDTSANMDELTESLREYGRTAAATGELTKLFGKDMGDMDELLQQAFDPTFTDRVGDVGVKISSLGGILGSSASMADKAKGKFADLDAALVKMFSSGNPDEAAASFDLIAEAVEAAGYNLDDLVRLLPNYAGAAGIGADASTRAAQEAKKLAEAEAAAGAAAEATAAQIDKLVSAILDLVSGEFDADRATIDLKNKLAQLAAAVKEATKAGKGNANSLKLGTQIGRDNASAVMDIVDAEAKRISVLVDSGASQDRVSAATRRAKKSLEDQLVQMGFNRAEVRKYINALDNIPDETRTVLGVETSGAMYEIDRVQRMIDGLRGRDIPITVTASGQVRSTGGGTIQTGGRTLAGGGYVRGPGGPREDAIPAWLSNGEFVVNASATSRHRGTLEHINAGRYATGGWVSGSGSSRLGAFFLDAKGVEEALKKVGDKLDKLNATLKEDKLGEIKKERAEFAKSVKAAFLEAANITQLPGVGTTGAQMVYDLHGQLDRATAFTDAMAKLRKQGLNETALDQLLAAGAEGGGLAAARQILTAGNVKQINALMAKIAEQGAKLGTREATVDFAKRQREAERERRELLAERRRLVAWQGQLNRRRKALEKADEDEKAEKAEAKKKARVSTRTTSSGTTLSAVRSSSDLSQIPVKVTFDVTGTDKHLKAWIRQIVRTDGGGSVQKAFGS